MDWLPAILESKRFYALLVLLAVIIGGEKTGLEKDQRQQLSLAVIGWILSDGLRPAEKKLGGQAKRRMKANGQIREAKVFASGDPGPSAGVLLLLVIVTSLIFAGWL